MEDLDQDLAIWVLAKETDGFLMVTLKPVKSMKSTFTGCWINLPIIYGTMIGPVKGPLVVKQL